MNLVSGVEVRFATQADIEPICRVSTQLFPGSSVALWRTMLRYPWMAEEEKPDHGVVLVTPDGEIAGFNGVMYSDRSIDGRVERFANAFGWGVLPEYRRYAVAIIRQTRYRTGITRTNFSSRADQTPFMLRLGYRLADERKLVSYFRPGLHLARRSQRPRIVPPFEVRAELLGPVVGRIYEDHLGRNIMQAAVLEMGGRLCLTYTKRAYHHGLRFPFTELHYVSDREFLARHFEGIKFALMMRDRTAGIGGDERVLGFVPKDSRTVPSTALFQSETVDRPHVDTLYSELTFLD